MVVGEGVDSDRMDTHLHDWVWNYYRTQNLADCIRMSIMNVSTFIACN